MDKSPLTTYPAKPEYQPAFSPLAITETLVVRLCTPYHQKHGIFPSHSLPSSGKTPHPSGIFPSELKPLAIGEEPRQPEGNPISEGTPATGGFVQLDLQPPFLAERRL